MYITRRQTEATSSFAENTFFLVYFEELFTNLFSAPLTIVAYDDIDISNYKKTCVFFKETYSTYTQNQAEIFTSDELTKFCNEAPNSQYLDIKLRIMTKKCLLFVNFNEIRFCLLILFIIDFLLFTVLLTFFLFNFFFSLSLFTYFVCSYLLFHIVNFL